MSGNIVDEIAQANVQSFFVLFFSVPLVIRFLSSLVQLFDLFFFFGWCVCALIFAFSFVLILSSVFTFSFLSYFDIFFSFSFIMCIMFLFSNS